MSKTALITGISGQDGSYLAELLLEKGYNVWGIIRRQSLCENQTKRIDHIFNDLNLEYGDLTDSTSINRIISKSQPDEIYNLGAQSHVKISFDLPQYTFDVNSKGVLNILEAIKTINPYIKLYQASSSEMFGNTITDNRLLNEDSPMIPVSPYGIAKLSAFNLIRNYRESYNLFAINGILFNHESPRRGENFVTNKVVKAAVEIRRGKRDYLPLGNLNASRDWGHSKDYVKAQYLMMQLDKPEDFVCATGISHTVRELCDYVFKSLALNYEDHVKIDPKYYRPEELNVLRGDASKLKAYTNWCPEYNFETMLNEMITYWLERI